MTTVSEKIRQASHRLRNAATFLELRDLLADLHMIEFEVRAMEAANKDHQAMVEGSDNIIRMQDEAIIDLRYKITKLETQLAVSEYRRCPDPSYHYEIPVAS